LENRLRQKGHEKDEAMKRIEKLAEHIKWVFLYIYM
jgi:hypothetical protein